MRKYPLTVAVVTAIMLVGCGKNPILGEGSGNKSDKTYLEYINKIEVGDSLDTINQIIGTKGQVQSDNATYSWEIGSGGVSAVFDPGDTSAAHSVSLNYNKKDVTNKDVVIKDLNDLKIKVSDGIHYDDFKEFLGGVDGVLVSKNTFAKGYVWRSTKGSLVKDHSLWTTICVIAVLDLCYNCL